MRGKIDIKAKTTAGILINLDTSILKPTIHGEVITSQDKEYDAVRMVGNGMIDKRPALIVQCAGTADVIKAVRLAKAHN